MGNQKPTGYKLGGIMETKLNLENVHTVQIEGADVQVVAVSEANKAAESLIGSVTENVTKETKTNVHRELSKTLGVNLFDDNAINTFVENQKQMVSKSDIEQYTTRIAALEPIEKEYKALQFDNAILKSNVDDTQIDKVRKLADLELSQEGMTYEKAVEKVITDFPFFVKGKKRGGMDPNYSPDSKTGYDQAVSKYEKNPYYKKD